MTDQVQQSAGRGDEHVDAAAQRADLRPRGDAAENDCRSNVQVFAVGLDAFRDLRGEFPGRCDDERPYRADAGPWASLRLFAEAVQQRQGKSGGFAGARLRRRHYVSPGEDGGNGLELDRCGCVVTLVGNGFLKRLGQAESGKRCFGYVDKDTHKF